MNFSRDLLPGQIMNGGDHLFSATRAFRVSLQAEDGNLVLSVLDDATLPRDSIEGKYVPIWEAGVGNTNTEQFSAVIQTDGNFVLTGLIPGPHGFGPIFATGTQGHPGAFLRCQDDGNVVLRAPDGGFLWHTNTFAGRR
jgi:hypothetical protein